LTHNINLSSKIDTDNAQCFTLPDFAAAADLGSGRKQLGHSGIQAELYYATPIIALPKGVLYTTAA
jgi:hypothetical protein